MAPCPRIQIAVTTRRKLKCRALLLPLLAVVMMVTSQTEAAAANGGGGGGGGGGAGRRLPFTLGVRDSFMIAHSFRHPDFGPAQGLHGATYTCDVEFLSEKLVEPQNWVVDIGMASSIVADVLGTYNYKNLDEVFPDGELTTTEFMARKVHEGIVRRLREERVDFVGVLRVKLFESHRAWASYEAEV